MYYFYRKDQNIMERLTTTAYYKDLKVFKVITDFRAFLEEWCDIRNMSLAQYDGFL